MGVTAEINVTINLILEACMFMHFVAWKIMESNNSDIPVDDKRKEKAFFPNCLFKMKFKIAWIIWSETVWKCRFQISCLL